MLSLYCSPDSKDANPSFESYTDGRLSLEWSTPDACPGGSGSPPASDGSDDGDGGSNGGGGGMGFFGFLRLLFWMGFTGLILYFAIGQSTSLACICAYGLMRRVYGLTYGRRHILQPPAVLRERMGPASPPGLLARVPDARIGSVLAFVLECERGRRGRRRRWGKRGILESGIAV